MSVPPLQSYDPRLGQEFTLNAHGRIFSSLEHQFYVLDNAGNLDWARGASLLVECIRRTSKRGFFTIVPWAPGAGHLVMEIKQWSQVFTGPDGTNSPVWTKTTTDFMGRSILQEKPGFGGGISTNSFTYNAKGQLVSQSTVNGLQSTVSLYDYNELGQQTRSGLDVNNNGTLDLAGPDRVNASDTSCQSDASGDIWQVRSSILYAGENSATPTTNSIQKSRLTGLSQISNLTAEMVATDLLGNQTLSRTYVDRDNKTVTQTVTYPDSTTNATQVSVNGLTTYSISKTGVRTDYTYDPLGRQLSASSPSPSRGEGGGEGVISSYAHYNSLGQVDWTEDAASNRTTFTYDDQGRRIATTDALTNTTHTAYDTEGQQVATWGATYPVAYEYDDYGRMTAMYTYRGSNSLSSYSGICNLKSEMDRTTWLYDLATGLLTNKLYADGKGTAYSYTPDGKLACRTWARGVATTYNYASRGLSTSRCCVPV